MMSGLKSLMMVFKSDTSEFQLFLVVFSFLASGFLLKLL